MSLGERLRIERNRLNLTQEEFGTHVGVTKKTQIHYEKNVRKPDTAYLERAAALGVDVNYVITGIHSNTSGEPIPLKKGDLKKVPVIGWVQAGSWSDIYETSLLEVEEWVLCPVPTGNKTFGLRVHGISMYNPSARPSFETGDVIFVDPDRDVVNKSLLIVKDEAQNEATFKQIIIEGGEKFLKPLNPDWPEQIIKLPATTSIVGVVIAKLETF